ncbi:NUDIX domain-containing protein [Paenibacillus sp. RC67]|uniref:NUDIX domain-containing protein n=1 Tax=Paenibacillus sp. RC67 TaxID=3039392 RepID=UPI0024ADCE1E|nr:NUDIX domain-containing protein [Paenibacillus sp. RC67]
MATAFLMHENRLLMMKKSGSKLFSFEFWGGIGGHLEEQELNSPMKASYREIKEETGFAEEEVLNFRLKYILIEMREGEVRQQFVYFGETKHPDFIVSDEGELFWIPQNELKQLRTSTLIKEMLEHYFLHPEVDHVIMGTFTMNEDQEPYIQWGSLKDPKVF